MTLPGWVKLLLFLLICVMCAIEVFEEKGFLFGLGPPTISDLLGWVVSLIIAGIVVAGVIVTAKRGGPERVPMPIDVEGYEQFMQDQESDAYWDGGGPAGR